jgi:hypothetical protein
MTVGSRLWWCGCVFSWFNRVFIAVQRFTGNGQSTAKVDRMLSFFEVFV